MHNRTLYGRQTAGVGAPCVPPAAIRCASGQCVPSVLDCDLGYSTGQQRDVARARVYFRPGVGAEHPPLVVTSKQALQSLVFSQANGDAALSLRLEVRSPNDPRARQVIPPLGGVSFEGRVNTWKKLDSAIAQIRDSIQRGSTTYFGPRDSSVRAQINGVIAEAEDRMDEAMDVEENWVMKNEVKIEAFTQFQGMKLHHTWPLAPTFTDGTEVPLYAGENAPNSPAYSDWSDAGDWPQDISDFLNQAFAYENVTLDYPLIGEHFFIKQNGQHKQYVKAVPDEMHELREDAKRWVVNLLLAALRLVRYAQGLTALAVVTKQAPGKKTTNTVKGLGKAKRKPRRNQDAILNIADLPSPLGDVEPYGKHTHPKHLACPPIMEVCGIKTDGRVQCCWKGSAPPVVGRGRKSAERRLRFR